MTLAKNMGSTDRLIRTIVGGALVLWALAGGPVWAWIGLIPLATAIVGWCPLYRLTGWNTREKPGGRSGSGPQAV